MFPLIYIYYGTICAKYGQIANNNLLHSAYDISEHFVFLVNHPAAKVGVFISDNSINSAKTTRTLCLGSGSPGLY